MSWPVPSSTVDDYLAACQARNPGVSESVIQDLRVADGSWAIPTLVDEPASAFWDECELALPDSPNGEQEVSAPLLSPPLQSRRLTAPVSTERPQSAPVPALALSVVPSPRPASSRRSHSRSRVRRVQVTGSSDYPAESGHRGDLGSAVADALVEPVDLLLTRPLTSSSSSIAASSRTAVATMREAIQRRDLQSAQRRPGRKRQNTPTHICPPPDPVAGQTGATTKRSRSRQPAGQPTKKKQKPTAAQKPKKKAWKNLKAHETRARIAEEGLLPTDTLAPCAHACILTDRLRRRSNLDLAGVGFELSLGLVLRLCPETNAQVDEALVGLVRSPQWLAKPAPERHLSMFVMFGCKALGMLILARLKPASITLGGAGWERRTKALDEIKAEKLAHEFPAPTQIHLYTQVAKRMKDLEQAQWGERITAYKVPSSGNRRSTAISLPLHKRYHGQHRSLLRTRDLLDFLQTHALDWETQQDSGRLADGATWQAHLQRTARIGFEAGMASCTVKGARHTKGRWESTDVPVPVYTALVLVARNQLNLLARQIVVRLGQVPVDPRSVSGLYLTEPERAEWLASGQPPEQSDVALPLAFLADPIGTDRVLAQAVDELVVRRTFGPGALSLSSGSEALWKASTYDDGPALVTELRGLLHVLAVVLHLCGREVYLAERQHEKDRSKHFETANSVFKHWRNLTRVPRTKEVKLRRAGAMQGINTVKPSPTPVAVASAMALAAAPVPPTTPATVPKPTVAQTTQTEPDLLCHETLQLPTPPHHSERPSSPRPLRIQTTHSLPAPERVAVVPSQTRPASTPAPPTPASSPAPSPPPPAPVAARRQPVRLASMPLRNPGGLSEGMVCLRTGDRYAHHQRVIKAEKNHRISDANFNLFSSKMRRPVTVTDAVGGRFPGTAYSLQVPARPSSAPVKVMHTEDALSCFANPT